MDGGGTEMVFSKARALGKITIADTSAGQFDKDPAYWKARLKGVLQHTDIFVPSFQEATMITGKDTIEEICKAFSVYGIKLLIPLKPL